MASYLLLIIPNRNISTLGSPLYVIFNYLEPLHGFPISSRVGIVWSALEQDAGSAIGEGAVDHVRVPGDPADVGNAAEDVVLKLRCIYSGGWNTEWVRNVVHMFH